MPVTLDEVRTSDAQPTVAPHRISNRPGFNQATVKFTPTGGTVRHWRVAQGATSRINGRTLGQAGAVCGLSRVGPATRPLAIPSGQQITEAIDYAETGAPADGPQTITVYALSDTGWL